MTKTFFLCFFATALTAQAVFQKKMDGISMVEGLAILPDGGYVIAGLKSNCIEIVRFDAVGTPLWMQQVCPENPGADITIGSLHLEADRQDPGAFLLLFRKGAFSSAPDNLLNLMKFDPSGGLVWESQLRPERRYGALSSGSQLAITPSGKIWAAHGMGATTLLPDFNQVLVFKLSSSGQILLRRFFLTDLPSTANGIVTQNDQEAYVYGSLVDASSDGFLLKLNDSGAVLWSKRYAGLKFLRDGGFFQNGDLLLMGEYHGVFSMTRVKPDGSIAWATKLADTLSLFHCTIAPDQRIVVAGRKPGGLAILFELADATGQPAWAKSYEDCSRYGTTALRCSADGGIVFTQSSISGLPRARLLKADALGRLSAECPVWDLAVPTMEPLMVETFPLQFTPTDKPPQVLEHIFKLTSTAIDIKDCCPTEYPDARFVLPDSVCINAPFSLVSAGNPCADEWYWQFPGAIPDQARSRDLQNILLTAPGEYPITLTESFGGCSSQYSDTLRAVMATERRIFAFSDTLLCPDAPFVVEPGLAGFDNWVWEDSSTASTRVFDPPIAGTFRLLAQQGFCGIMDSFRIVLGKCEPTRVFAPNVFTPNDDGQNDLWEIFWQQGVSILACDVYDRWGNLCYAIQKDAMPRWDGTFRGRPAAAGVYVWHIRLRNAAGQEEALSGDLLLLR